MTIFKNPPARAFEWATIFFAAEQLNIDRDAIHAAIAIDAIDSQWMDSGLRDVLCIDLIQARKYFAHQASEIPQAG
jgi:hypothetical protein